MTGRRWEGAGVLTLKVILARLLSLNIRIIGPTVIEARSWFHA